MTVTFRQSEQRAPDRDGPTDILIILHQETSSPGRVGQMLVEKGFGLDIRRPVLGHDLPRTLNHHAGGVIFGGPMSANDEDEAIRREIDWLAVPLAEDKPYLGICLGAQMLARQLGARVGSHPHGLAEIGWYPIAPTAEGRKLIDWPNMVYQFHREGFDLPAGARLLATADHYPNQAFAYGRNAWGIQFHAELTHAMMHRWVVRGAHRFVLPGAQQGRQHLSGRWRHDGPLRAWLWGFLDIVFGSPPCAAPIPMRAGAERD